MLVPSIFNTNFTEPFFDDDFFSLSPIKKHTGFFTPMRTDIQETDDKYELSVELPGFNKEDIKAELHDGALTISASHEEKKEETDKKSGKVIRSERYTGNMKRSFYVGDNVTEDDIKAEYKQGLLHIEVPKKKPEVPERKQIAIS